MAAKNPSTVTPGKIYEATTMAKALISQLRTRVMSL